MNSRRSTNGQRVVYRSLGQINECCCAFGFHRFDCAAVPPIQRGRGPVLPTGVSC